MEIFPLFEGEYWVDNNKIFTPIDLNTTSIVPVKNAIKVAIKPFLIKHKQHLILCDLGLGFKNKNNTLNIVENLQKLNIQPHDITMVLLSHLHKDHCSGLFTNLETDSQLTFFNAKHYIHRQEFHYALNTAPEKYPHVIIQNLLKIESQISWLEQDSGWIDDFIYYEISGGHCPYHQVFKVFDTNKNIVFFGGDELPQYKFLLYKIKTFYDFDPIKSMHLRSQWAKIAELENWKFLYYHDAVF